MKFLSLMVLFLVAGFSPAYASEVDHFSSLSQNVEDAGSQVDKLISEALVRALKNLNHVSGKACDEVELYDMIYAELGVLKYEGKRSSAGYARKIIEKYQLHTEKKNEDAVVEISDQQEKGLWGLQGTGIYSYADMAANLDGYKFWNSLARGKEPYFSCTKGVWKQARSFSLKDYVSPAWDESVNCSDYLPKFQREIGLNIANILKKQNLKETSCPVFPAQCRGLGQRYKQWAPKVIHPLCLKIGS